ncbi:MAG: replication-associated recombination protein A [Desulforhopalus sp.]|nr:replication-associated recombination protein A [Desulforhopalus sp.]
MRQVSVFEETGHSPEVPLAEKARPIEIEDLFGQDQLLTPGFSLRQMIENDQYGSFILWGPPGSGKTTIARLIEKKTKHTFCSCSAVLSKIAEVKGLMEKAAHRHSYENRKTIVFVDEIHRFNKAQQDAFLPYVESGAVTLIGTTTENPSFEVIPALLSRCHVFVLEPLSVENLHKILHRAVSLVPKHLTCEGPVLQFIAEKAGGDARKALNDLEMVCRNAETGDTITLEAMEKATNTRCLFYDKNGEEHYNLISAFQKSIRGSDPQAALYWLARMLEGGETPLYLARRLVRIASEDIGLADPQALVQSLAAKDAVHFLGMPDAAVALCQATVYLATAPKSNALETAYLAAKDDAGKTSHLKVPLAIRNAPTKLMEDLGYNKGYRYSHDFDNHYSYQKYFPDAFPEKAYYSPSPFGFEKEIQKRLDWWKRLRDAQLQEKNDPPND